MKFLAVQSLVVEAEKLKLSVAKAIEARKALKSDLGDAAFKDLATAFPNPDRMADFAKCVPTKPFAEDLLKAFADKNELGSLVKDVLGGDMALLGALVTKGCKGDMTKLKGLFDQFKGDPKALRAVLTEGGFAAHPDSLAAVLDGGCDGDPAKLATFVSKFADKNDRKKLNDTLAKGGLGNAPAALGALAKVGGGDALVKLAKGFTSDDDLKKLNEMLTKGGLDGSASGRPGALADMVEKGLGGDPVRLKEFHQAFGSDGMARMADMTRGLDSTDGKVGERLKRTMDGFNRRGGGAVSNADLAKKMNDPFMSSVEKLGRANGSPDLTSKAGTSAAEALGKRPAADPGQLRGSLEGTMANDGGGALLAITSTDPKVRAESGRLEAAGALAGSRIEALGKATPGVNPDPEQSARTKDATKTANEAAKKVVDSMATPPDLKDVTALEAALQALLDEAEQEPAGQDRSDALKAAGEAKAALGQALAALAAKAVGAQPEAGAAVRAGQALALRKGKASDAEMKALKAGSEAAGKAAGLSVAAGQDPKTSAAAQKQAVEDAFLLNDRQAEEERRNDAADAAAGLAKTLLDALKTAKAPVPADLLTRAAAAAEAAVAVGREACDEAKAKAVFDAAKELTAQIAKGCDSLVAASMTSAAHGSPDAKKGLAVGGRADDAVAALEATSTKKGSPESKDLAAAAALARESSFALLELEGLSGDAAKAKAGAKAAKARGTADQDAIKAGTEAKAKRDVLQNFADNTPGSVTKALIEELKKLADAALEAARRTEDDGQRATVLAQAKEAYLTVSDATDKLAGHLLTAAQTQLAADQKTKSDTAGGSVRGLRTGANPVPQPAVKAAATDIRAAREAMADKGKSVLNGLARTEAVVITARDDATQAEAEAALPGASHLKKLAAAEKKAALARKLAEKMEAKFIATVGGTSAGSSAADFRAALAEADATNSALAAWREAAEGVVTLIAKLKQELEGIKPPSTENTNDLNALPGRKVTAEGEVAAAITGQSRHKMPDPPQQNPPAPAGPPTTLGNLVGHIGAATLVANQAPVVPSNKDELRDLNGFAKTLSLEGARGGGNIQSNPRDELVKIASAVGQNPYTGPATVTRPTTSNPGTNENTDVDLKHICGRHVSESYNYSEETDSGPRPDDHTVGTMIDGAYTGAGNTGPNAPDDGEKKLRESGKQNKPNSLLPEGVKTAGDTTTIAIQAAKVIKGTGSLIGILRATIPPPPSPQTDNKAWLQVDVDVLGPPPCKVTVGLQIKSGKPFVRMMYAANAPTLTMPDMNVLGKAIGL